MATAVVFPIVFSIGGAYKRRENALGDYGSLKSHCRSIYFASRDWISEPEPFLVKRVEEAIFSLLDACRELFASPIDEMREREKKVYAAFSQLSVTIRSFREADLASGEVSRCNQYLSKAMLAFESIKHVYQYRTPRTLRAYSRFYITILPVAYGPYFAAVSQGYSPELQYVLPVLFTAILVSLDNIQDHLENPFDQVGEDDVNIRAEGFVRSLEL